MPFAITSFFIFFLSFCQAFSLQQRNQLQLGARGGGLGSQLQPTSLLSTVTVPSSSSSFSSPHHHHLPTIITTKPHCPHSFLSAITTSSSPYCHHHTAISILISWDQENQGSTREERREGSSITQLSRNFVIPPFLVSFESTTPTKKSMQQEEKKETRKVRLLANVLNAYCLV